MYILHAVGSCQIILPVPNLERAYQSDKGSEAVLKCLQYQQCAGPQKQEVINKLLKPKIRNFNFQNLNRAYFLLTNFKFWCRYFSKHFLKPKF